MNCRKYLYILASNCLFNRALLSVGFKENFSARSSDHPCNTESRHISPRSCRASGCRLSHRIPFTESFIFAFRFASTGSPGSADPMLEVIIQEKLKGISRDASDRNDKYRKCKQLLMVKHPLCWSFVFALFSFMPSRFQKVRLFNMCALPVAPLGGEGS